MGALPRGVRPRPGGEATGVPLPLAIEIAHVSAPDWFTEAIASPCEDRNITVEDCSIHYRLWPGPEGSPGLLLVHGNGAHARWWDFIAPQLTTRMTVAAIDLSGMGDSGHRSTYRPDLFASEVMSVARDAGFGDRTILLGHSFGGFICRLDTVLYPGQVRALILADSAFGSRNGPRSNPRTRQLPPLAKEKRPTRVYGTLDEACRRFRLRPSQPCANDYILRHIAVHSLRQVDGGWSFKLDPLMFRKMVPGPTVDGADPAQLVCAQNLPVGFIYGEKSMFFPTAMATELEQLFDPGNVLVVEDAHHHLFLDNPLGFIQQLDLLLAQWSIGELVR
jgi:pimeloyl-ACP methyl ester carboxylesterase